MLATSQITIGARKRWYPVVKRSSVTPMRILATTMNSKVRASWQAGSTTAGANLTLRAPPSSREPAPSYGPSVRMRTGPSPSSRSKSKLTGHSIRRYRSRKALTARKIKTMTSWSRSPRLTATQPPSLEKVTSTRSALIGITSWASRARSSRKQRSLRELPGWLSTGSLRWRARISIRWH